jgi:CO/xanthine dehydrogenase FAD-binding subunit
MLSITTYIRAESVKAASAYLSLNARARAMAGGTDLLVASRAKGLSIEAIVDLKTIPGLAGIRASAEEAGPPSFEIGALTTIHDLERAVPLVPSFPHIVEAASQLGSHQIRHRATVGGNLCNASPAAEMACPLLTADAVVSLASTAGTRRLPLREFLVAPGRTALGPGELLTAVTFPALRRSEASYGCAYIKLGPRRAMDIAVVNVAAVVGLAGGRLTDVRVALGSVAPTPLRVPDVEASLAGREPTEALTASAARQAQSLVRPISDIRASAGYRSEMVRELVAQALREAIGRAKAVDGGSQRHG